ncbi:MAG: hypothetical protein ABFD45_03640 [Smithella sp.]
MQKITNAIKIKDRQKPDTNPPSIPTSAKTGKKQGGFKKSISFNAIFISVCFNLGLLVDSSLCNAILGRLEGLAYSQLPRAF